MSDGAPIEIVGPDVVGGGDLAALEPVVEQVFGRGDRSPGWFARKLAREGVEAELSCVAVPVGADPRPIFGFTLVGHAPSLGSVVRGAGVGVVTALRGRGIGRRMLDDACDRARAHGFDAIEFLAEPARTSWYVEQGFVVVEQHVALLAHGLGQPNASLPLLDPRSTSAPVEREDNSAMGPTALWSWTPEIWTLTPSSDRTVVECGAARFWLTREGRAWLSLRCELDDPAELLASATALRRQLAPNTPVFLYPCPAEAPWVDALVGVGFAVAQRSFVVRRNT